MWLIQEWVKDHTFIDVKKTKLILEEIKSFPKSQIMFFLNY